MVLGKLMEQIILNAITQHMQGSQMIGPSQCGFMKGRLCLTNLVSFYNRVTHLVDDEKAVDVVYLIFSKVFGTVSPQHLPGKNCLLMAWMDGHFSG